MACSNCREHGHSSSICPYTVYNFHATQPARELIMGLLDRGLEFIAIPYDKVAWTVKVRREDAPDT